MQTSYSNGLARGLPGLVAFEFHEPAMILTYRNPTEAIPFGLAVTKIAGVENGVDLPSLVGDKFLGVAVRDNTIAAEGDAYPIRTPVAVLSSGDIWVTVDQDVTADDPVFYRFGVNAHVAAVVFSGAIGVGQTVNGTVNGVAIAAVPYNTSNAQTLTDLAAAIQALDSVATAVSNGTNTITVTGANGGEVLNVILVVTGAGSPPTASQATVSGPSSGSQKGAFRKDADNTGTGAVAAAVTQAKFLVGASAGGVALLDLNLP